MTIFIYDGIIVITQFAGIIRYTGWSERRIDVYVHFLNAPQFCTKMLVLPSVMYFLLDTNEISKPLPKSNNRGHICSLLLSLSWESASSVYLMYNKGCDILDHLRWNSSCTRWLGLAMFFFGVRQFLQNMMEANTSTNLQPPGPDSEPEYGMISTLKS